LTMSHRTESLRCDPSSPTWPRTRDGRGYCPSQAAVRAATFSRRDAGKPVRTGDCTIQRLRAKPASITPCAPCQPRARGGGSRKMPTRSTAAVVQPNAPARDPNHQHAGDGLIPSRLFGCNARFRRIRRLAGLPLRFVDHRTKPIQFFRGGRLGAEQCDHHPIERPIEDAVDKPPG